MRLCSGRSARLRRWGLPVLLAIPLVASCVGLSRPVVRIPEAASAQPEVPVVLVPGLTGSMLRDRVTGEVAWGRGADLLCPRDGGYSLALPVGRRPGGGERRLEAFAILEELRLGPLRRGVYRPLLESLQANGYRRGRLGAPTDAGATLFTFAYDWRRSIVDAAGELAAALEELRRSRGTQLLRVDLVCQSSGGSVCRWLAKYGGSTLAEAEAGRPRSPAGVRVRRMVLVGSANGGSLRILRELDRGRRYLAPIGRRMRPEVLFTFPALYEDLPHEADGLLLNGRGAPLPEAGADLYEVGTWRKLGWSVFGEDTSRRLATAAREDLFGTPEQRVDHLERSLGEARRVHALLAEDPPSFGGHVQYHLVGNAYEETPARAVVVRREGAWRTLFTGDRRLERRPYLAALASAPGDGHATVRSMNHLSQAERRALATEPFLVRGGHFSMILEPAVHRRIAEVLLR